MDEVLVLYPDSFKYWFWSDAVDPDPPGYPISGSYLLDRHWLTLQTQEIQEPRRTLDVIYGTKVIWCESALNYYRETGQYYSSGILIYAGEHYEGEELPARPSVQLIKPPSAAAGPPDESGPGGRRGKGQVTPTAVASSANQGLNDAIREHGRPAREALASTAQLGTEGLIRELLENPEPAVRCFAARRLGEKNAAEAVPALIEAVNDHAGPIFYEVEPDDGAMATARIIPSVSQEVTQALERITGVTQAAVVREALRTGRGRDIDPKEAWGLWWESNEPRFRETR